MAKKPRKAAAAKRRPAAHKPHCAASSDHSADAKPDPTQGYPIHEERAAPGAGPLDSPQKLPPSRDEFFRDGGTPEDEWEYKPLPAWLTALLWFSLGVIVAYCVTH